MTDYKTLTVSELCVRLGHLLTLKQENRKLTPTEWEDLDGIIAETYRRAHHFEDVWPTDHVEGSA